MGIVSEIALKRIIKRTVKHQFWYRFSLIAIASRRIAILQTKLTSSYNYLNFKYYLWWNHIFDATSRYYKTS